MGLYTQSTRSNVRVVEVYMRGNLLISAAVHRKCDEMGSDSHVWTV